MAKTKAKEEVEELDESSEETEKPKKGATDEVTFGVADLCRLVKKKTGKEYSTRDMRTLLRKMAREEKPRVAREITAGNRSRYDWTGPNDPEVKAVLKAVEKGEIEAGRKEALDKLKEKKAKEKAKEGKGKSKDKAKGKSKGKTKASDDDDDTVDEIEDLDDDD